MTESFIEKAFGRPSKPAKGSEGEKYSTGEKQQVEEKKETNTKAKKPQHPKMLQVSISVNDSSKAKVVGL